MTDTVHTARRFPLLSSMAHDLDEHGSLRTGTAAAMWAAYTTHTALTGWAMARPVRPLPLHPWVSRVIGAALVPTGAGLCIAGMTRFASAQELTGTRNETLRTSGVYRYSRNPQYLGYLVALTGASLARRSGSALSLVAFLATVYSAWIPVEEQHLTRLHGQPYINYTRQTHRWWGRRG